MAPELGRSSLRRSFRHRVRNQTRKSAPLLAVRRSVGPLDGVRKSDSGYLMRAIIQRVASTLALSDTVPPLPPSFTRTKKLLPALRCTW